MKEPYAVLSHVWSYDEQVFRDVQRLERSTFTYPSDAQNTHSILSGLSPKIASFCERACTDGFELAWMDSCCIDSSSSAEVSEVVNAVYEWFRRAAVCYVYLADVESEDDPFAPNSQFRQSRWHSRLWALQELLAPSRIIFLSKDWHALGTKASLSVPIQEVTGIPRSVLLGITPLSSVSVARRMSWASRRRTTRIEDYAYALMGLFGIKLPTIYGEGYHAFTRLQEKILRQIPDQSIFLWGPFHCALPHRLPSFLSVPLAAGAGPESGLGRANNLLALAPQDFEHSGAVRAIPYANLIERLGDFGISEPDYMITSYGIRTKLPVYTVSHGRYPIHIAVLACTFDDDDLLGLLLQPDELRPVREGYVVGAIILDKPSHAQPGPGGRVVHRALRLSQQVIARLGSPTLTEVHIWRQYDSDMPTAPRVLGRELDWTNPATFTYKILFPKWRRRQLQNRGIAVSWKTQAGEDTGHSFVFTMVRQGQASGDESVMVRIGPCLCAPSSRPPPMGVAVWASRRNGSTSGPVALRSPTFSLFGRTPTLGSFPTPGSPLLMQRYMSPIPDLLDHSDAPSDSDSQSPAEQDDNERKGDNSASSQGPPGQDSESHLHITSSKVVGNKNRSGEPEGTTFSRVFTCNDPAGGLVAELKLTLDPAPDLTAASSGHPWDQIYTLDMEPLYFHEGPGDMRKDAGGTVVKSWGYDPTLGKFMLMERKRKSLLNAAPQTPSP